MAVGELRITGGGSKIPQSFCLRPLSVDFGHVGANGKCLCMGAVETSSILVDEEEWRPWASSGIFVLYLHALQMSGREVAIFSLVEFMESRFQSYHPHPDGPAAAQEPPISG